jgi:hypothetical protein
MIIIKLLGGLGNQMFQYAFAKHVAIKNKEPLYIDLSVIERRNNIIDYTFRDFGLNVFNAEYRILQHTTLAKGVRKIYNYFFPIQNILEQKYSATEVLNLHGNIYLHGFWQNENYFKDIAHILRKDFTFKTQPGELNQKMINQINAANSISVHIRRGDYVTSSIASQVHYLCPKEYYEKAVSYYIEKMNSPHFYIFSDDIHWVKENLSFGSSYTFVDYNKGKYSFEDMRLMSLCKHNIIANSSFSWWGAWLNNNPDKIIIAPRQWLKEAETEIVPREWIKM